MKATHTGLILRYPHPKAWHLGSGKATERFGGDLNPSADWSTDIPPFEPQSRPGFDPQSCALEHTIRAYITLARYLGYDFLADGAERYTGVWAGTGPEGSDPYIVAESTRKNGLIPQSLMPWTDQTTFETYYDRAVAANNLPFGRALTDRFTFGYEWVFPFGSSYTPQEKADRLADALRRGPVCVSISGNYRTKRGRLYKNAGDRDSHWVQLVRVDQISDSYDPQFKKLSKLYDHDAAMVYFLKPAVPPTNWWQMVVNFFLKSWKPS